MHLFHVKHRPGPLPPATRHLGPRWPPHPREPGPRALDPSLHHHPQMFHVKHRHQGDSLAPRASLPPLLRPMRQRSPCSRSPPQRRRLRRRRLWRLPRQALLPPRLRGQVLAVPQPQSRSWIPRSGHPLSMGYRSVGRRRLPKPPQVRAPPQNLQARPQMARGREPCAASRERMQPQRFPGRLGCGLVLPAPLSMTEPRFRRRTERLVPPAGNPGAQPHPHCAARRWSPVATPSPGGDPKGRLFRRCPGPHGLERRGAARSDLVSVPARSRLHRRPAFPSAPHEPAASSLAAKPSGALVQSTTWDQRPGRTKHRRHRQTQSLRQPQQYPRPQPCPQPRRSRPPQHRQGQRGARTHQQHQTQRRPAPRRHPGPRACPPDQPGYGPRRQAHVRIPLCPRALQRPR